MPKYRQLHTKIIDSYDFNEMPDDFTRVFWMLLTVVVDSEGRAIDNVSWLRSRMFPLRENVTSSQINSAVDWLANRNMVIRYQANGRSYFYIPTFKSYQSGTEKEAKSVLPPPPELVKSYSGVTTEKLKADCIVSESVFESAIVLNGADNENLEWLDEEGAISQLSKQFEVSAQIMAYDNDKWLKALQEMFHAGVAPELLGHLVYEMKNPQNGNKKLTVTGPWSCTRMAIARAAENRVNPQMVDVGGSF